MDTSSSLAGIVTPVAIVCDLTCESLEVLKERVSALLSGEARFEGASRQWAVQA